MTANSDLRSLAESLQITYDKALSDLSEVFDDPRQVRDTNGRYVLLDALTALVSAQAALVSSEEETH